MPTVPFTQVAHMLQVDAKTLRQWIKQANLLLQPSPTDARVKCLTDEQLHQLAAVHGRCIDLDVALPSDQEFVPSEMPTPLPSMSPFRASLDPVASPPSLQEAFITDAPTSHTTRSGGWTSA